MESVQHSPLCHFIFQNIVTRGSDYSQGFRLEIGFIDQFNTQLVTTINYSTLANHRASQITTAHVKSFQSVVSSSVFPW
jgi:hypothetical protein